MSREESSFDHIKDFQEQEAAARELAPQGRLHYHSPWRALEFALRNCIFANTQLKHDNAAKDYKIKELGTELETYHSTLNELVQAWILAAPNLVDPKIRRFSELLEKADSKPQRTKDKTP